MTVSMSDSKAHGQRRKASVIASVAQVIVTGLVYFLLFRYLYDRIGIEQVGVWSLVTATTSVSRIAELGLSAGVVRFVALALGSKDEARAAEVIQTTTVTLAVFMCVALIALYPAAVAVIRIVVPAASIGLAIDVLPYALVSLWINVVASVFSGGLDGCMRIDLRCIATGASHIMLLVCAIVLTPIWELRGVALAQLLQALGLLLSTWWLLKRQLRALPIVPLHWRKSLFREMIGYGLSFQVISIMNMLFEPMAKALMSKFGGLEALGFYEMANKLILQGRSVIVEASRFLVPSIAALPAGDSGKARDIFVTSYRVIFYVAVVFFGLLGIALTGISLVWLGHYERTFVQFALILNVGWFINTLVVPAYFSNLGSGSLRANVISHAVMGVVAAVAGWALGIGFGGLGVLIGTTLGLVSGSLILSIGHIIASGFRWTSLVVPQGMAGLSVATLALALASNGYGAIDHSFGPVTVTALGCAGLLFLTGWFNPMRTQLQRKLS